MKQSKEPTFVRRILQAVQMAIADPRVVEEGQSSEERSREEPCMDGKKICPEGKAQPRQVLEQMQSPGEPVGLRLSNRRK